MTKKLRFIYNMNISYSIEVARCNFTIKCVPKDTKRQHILGYGIEVSPPVKYNFGKDGLNNIQIYGLNEKAHKEFEFKIYGTAITGLEDYEEEIDDDLSMIFNHPHGLNLAGDNIYKFYQTLKLDKKLSIMQKVVRIMNSLYEKFNYESFSTTVNTSAEEAFSQGKGVCQDYAHIFIALLHLEKIPARYVTGLIIGEGQSHAWVEFLVGDKWYGIDPTNNKMVGNEYIKIGIGRDAKDCTINRGIMHGGGIQTQIINVVVEETD